MASPMVPANRRVFIIHGSETGKAESIADIVAAEAEAKGLQPIVTCMSAINEKFDVFRERVVVAISSTTGDGEQPEKARKMLQVLRRSDPADRAMRNTRLAYLGLGDTNYNQFCNGPKTMRSKMLELGAVEICPPGWADDGIGLELVVEPWIESLWQPLIRTLQELPEETSHQSEETSRTLTTFFGIRRHMEMDIEQLIDRLAGTTIAEPETRNRLKESDKSYDDISIPALPEPYLKLDIGGTVGSIDDAFITSQKYPLAGTDVFRVPVACVRKLTDSPDVKRAYLVTLNLSKTTISCEPGDAIGIVCQNPKVEVDVLLERLGISSEEADREYDLSLAEKTTKRNPKIPSHIPKSKFTLRQLFTKALDIRSIPKKPFLRCLAEHTSSASERQRLLSLCSREGASEYLSLFRGQNIGLLDVLLTFRSCSPPVEALLEHLPRLAPRPYSAASVVHDGGLVDIVFNVVDIPLGGGRAYPRRGLCTAMFEDMATDSEMHYVYGFGRSNNTFRLPPSPDANMIFIGPGTGVAPFRGFLQQRSRQRVESDSSNAGKILLFFGCRHEEKDFLFRSDLQEFVSEGVLTEVITCFSRDDPDWECRYVQHGLRKRREEVVRAMFPAEGEGCYIYVCGDAKNMAKQVNEVIIECVAQVLNIPDKEAKAKVANLVVNRRYLQDVWT